jgi:hypothetical protein
MRRRLPGSSSLDRVRWAVNPKDATRTPAAPVCHPDSAVGGTTRAGANRPSWSSQVADAGHMAIRAVTEMEREREALAAVRATRRTEQGSFLLPRTPVHMPRNAGKQLDPRIKKERKEKGKGRSQANTGGGERRVGKKADVTVSANQPLPVFALPTGDDHHSQLKRTHQYV